MGARTILVTGFEPFTPCSPDMRAQLAQQKNVPCDSTPCPTTLQPQCAHVGASLWIAHSKLSNVWRRPPAVTSKALS